MRPLLFLAFFFSLSSIIYAQPTIEWQRAYGGSKNELLGDITQTSDGGYILLGSTTSDDGDVTGQRSGIIDIWVVKMSATGSIEWQKTYGGSGSDFTYADGGTIAETNDGGYIFIGSTNSTDGDIDSNHGGYDAWVVKLKPTGDIE